MRSDERVENWFREKLAGLKKELQERRAERQRLDERIKKLEAEVAAGETFYRSQIGGAGGSAGKGGKAEDAKLRFVGMSIPEAAALVLEESRGPLRAKSIWSKLKAGGVVIHSKTPLATVVSAMSRNKARFERTAPNTFRLVKQNNAGD